GARRGQSERAVGVGRVVPALGTAAAKAHAQRPQTSHTHILRLLLSHLSHLALTPACVTGSDPAGERSDPLRGLVNDAENTEEWLKRMSSPLCATMALEWL
ncbi:hypothetical protein ACJX0J_017573, partial [Zea mays]